ncbi:HAMP domain-containing sensor histidine kinase [Desulfosporosinus sp. FKB]|uniref:HAMP domain-containing sensor histidine kinase n=1 Tax=Desulfosporosinus sp. FKB TaxID=1969835 RepID=UPI000B49FEA8|nr:HAMP domain-containing sensor histidine kinase [Desulfosporosinus sp. FKB]
MREPKVPPHVALRIIFSIVVFVILAITNLIVGTVVFSLIQVGVLKKNDSPNVMFLVVMLAIVSILVGTVVAAVISRIPLKPVNVLINAMNRLASGDYGAMIDLGNFSIAREVSESFNTMASELQNTEMLRSDFVNNFSHEFKTPIVSIRGFAKLLKKENFTDELQREYLDIIVNESNRLADMATNVLDLTKIENQSILTDVTRFNLSEQIRNCVLLLEKKWSQKSLTITVDFDEYEIDANEEMLKQVWINLIDNAVKFSPIAGEIGISITKSLEVLAVSIKNNGTEICEEDRKRIFSKFYQGDTSHSSEGTGIGLSIVKRIIELHKGSISVISSPEETTFTILLPKE